MGNLALKRPDCSGCSRSAECPSLSTGDVQGFGGGGFETGVTLPETLVALLILSFATLSILSLFSFSTKLNSAALDYTSLTTCARDKMEELLDLSWHTDPKTGKTLMDPALSSRGRHQEIRTREHIRILWRIQDFTLDVSQSTPPGHPASHPEAANLKRIIVTTISTSKAGIGRRDTTFTSYRIKD